MPYQISAVDVDRIAKGLEEYYEEAWQAGIKNVVASMGRSQMGLATAYLDQAKDTWANLTKKSKDSFRVTFKSSLKQQVGLYFANKYDVMTDLVAVGEKLIDKLANMIPFPKLASVASGAATFAAGKAKDELHNRSITEADKLLAARSDAELQKMFANDKDTLAFVENSMKQYKTLTNFMSALPTNVSTFDDAITFPKSAFKVQQAASSLNVALWSIRQYLEAMSERLVKCQEVSADYIKTVRTEMPKVVTAVLNGAYSDGMTKGKTDVSSKKYNALPAPALPKSVTGGGATLLANYVAHALAQGYYDAGNTGPTLASAPKMPPILKR